MAPQTVLWLWGRMKWIYSEHCFWVRINKAWDRLDAACEKGQREPRVSGLYIWEDGGIIYWNREHRKKRRFERGSDVFSFKPLVFRCLWDISADLEDTAANQKRKQPAVQNDKLCSSLFSAARWADWLVIKYIRVEPYFSFGVAVGH